MKSDLRIDDHTKRVIETAVSALNESQGLGEETRQKLEVALNNKFAGIRAVNLINGTLVIGLEKKEGEIGVPFYLTVESHIWQKQSSLKPEMKKLLHSKSVVSDQIIPANDANHTDELDKAS